MPTSTSDTDGTPAGISTTKERLNGGEVWRQLEELKAMAYAAALNDEEKGFEFQTVYGRVCRAMDEFEVKGGRALTEARAELNRLWGIEE